MISLTIGAFAESAKAVYPTETEGNNEAPCFRRRTPVSTCVGWDLRYERNIMNKWQRLREEREDKEDRAGLFTLPKLMTRVAFFGALIGFLMWWPWALVPKLLICAGAALAYMTVHRSTPLGRHM